MARQQKEYIVGDASDLPDGTHRVVRVGRREIGIFNINGTLHALPNLCPHQLGPLCTGKLAGTLIAGAETEWKLQWAHEGEIIVCPWHGLEFEVSTGQCLAFQEIRLRTYDIWVEEDKIKLRF